MSKLSIENLSQELILDAIKSVPDAQEAHIWLAAEGVIIPYYRYPRSMSSEMADSALDEYLKECSTYQIIPFSIARLIRKRGLFVCYVNGEDNPYEDMDELTPNHIELINAAIQKGGRIHRIQVGGKYTGINGAALEEFRNKSARKWLEQGYQLYEGYFRLKNPHKDKDEPIGSPRLDFRIYRGGALILDKKPWEIAPEVTSYDNWFSQLAEKHQREIKVFN